MYGINNVPPNCAKLCVLYQLSAWHDYEKCPDIHFIWELTSEDMLRSDRYYDTK